MFSDDVQTRQKTTAKNDILTALKAQKKPPSKKHVLKHIKKAQKISEYSRSAPPASIESVNFYHALKCAFFGDNSARKNHTIKGSFTRHNTSEICFIVKPAKIRIFNASTRGRVNIQDSPQEAIKTRFLAVFA